MIPKMTSTTPPMMPILVFTREVSVTVIKPNASTITKVNSTHICANEKTSPLRAPDLDPYDIVAKNIGPGAKTPDAVSRLTVVMKLRRSMLLRC